MNSYEMKEVSSNAKEQTSSSSDSPHSEAMDNTTSLWTWAAALLFTLLAALFSIFPQFLLFISHTSTSPDVERRTELTPLELFLATHFGIWLVTFAISLILNIPSQSPFQTAGNNQGHPLLMPSTIASLFTAFLSYNTKSVGSLAPIYCVFTGISGIWGLWVVVFGSTVRRSKTTGADKHTSTFIFGNKTAASQQKKRWLKEQKKAS
ncbi:hypothetical protein Moror_8000 [Moniliophthora roreri MCA 2997]|uniref:Transmembrane protein n=2 Tax=Moniliophthora roreri TaxID=221103 RepID=V2X5V8_MONRO|nr:hypothetical protein Moror_8000 [Moniliophthora roreri MCA 2997]